MYKSFILKSIIPPVFIILLIFFLFKKQVKPSHEVSEIIEDVEFVEIMDPAYDSILTSFDLYMQDALKDKYFPGAAVAIVKNNKTLFKKCYGIKEYGSNDSIDLHTVFRLGSVSKGFAAVLAGVFVSERQLNWDDTVKNFLSDFNLMNDDYEKQLTIRHLLSHTTGLPMHAYTVLLDDNVPYEEIKPLLCSIPPIGPPGAYYSYQNVAYSLIADVLEVKTGKNYSELLDQKLFGPLGMNDASSDYETIINSKDVASPHVKLKNGEWLPEKHNKRYYSVGPAAGVNASISDMNKWLMAMLGGMPETIDTSLLNEIFQPQINCNNRWKYKRNWKKIEKSFYGLGWRVFEYGETKIVFHSGYVRGYKAEIALIPQEKTGIVMLCNGATNYSNNCLPKFIDDYLAITLK